MTDKERLEDIKNVLNRFKPLNPKINGRDGRNEYMRRHREKHTSALIPYERREKRSPIIIEK